MTPPSRITPRLFQIQDLRDLESTPKFWSWRQEAQILGRLRRLIKSLTFSLLDHKNVISRGEIGVYSETNFLNLIWRHRYRFASNIPPPLNRPQYLRMTPPIGFTRFGRRGVIQTDTPWSSKLQATRYCMPVFPMLFWWTRLVRDGAWYATHPMQAQLSDPQVYPTLTRVSGDRWSGSLCSRASINCRRAATAERAWYPQKPSRTLLDSRFSTASAHRNRRPVCSSEKT